MMKNAGSVHGTIGKELQQIEGDNAVISQRQKMQRICVVCAMNIRNNIPITLKVVWMHLESVQ